MADITISLTIPEAKITTALQGFLKIYPNKEMTTDVPPVAKYTDRQWVTEQIRRLIIRDIHRGLQMAANEAAVVTKDNALITV